MSVPLLFPDYQNSILNIPCTLLKHFGLRAPHGTLAVLEQELAAHHYQNIVLMVFDGMGMAVLEKNLPPESFLRRHIRQEITSVFPPTTAAAITAIQSGLSPVESGWLGWNAWFEEFGRPLVLFTNKDFYTQEPVDGADVRGKILKTPHINEMLQSKLDTRDVSNLNNFCGTAHKVENLEQWFAEIETLCQSPKHKFIYGSWNNPDSEMHKNGVESPAAKEILSVVNRYTEQLADKLKNTLLIITADHGMTDVESLYLDDYPELEACLEHAPTLEPRFCSFKLKPGCKSQFQKLFEQVFGEDFLLMSKEEVLERKLTGCGSPHPRAAEFMGDILAIAVGNKILQYRMKGVPQPKSFAAHHAGLTADEMRVPLVLITAK